MPPGDIAPALFASLLTLTIGGVLILRGPIGRALARRLEGGSSELEARVAELEARVAAGDEERHELVERLDFAERLLARGEGQETR